MKKTAPPEPVLPEAQEMLSGRHTLGDWDELWIGQVMSKRPMCCVRFRLLSRPKRIIFDAPPANANKTGSIIGGYRDETSRRQ